MKENEMSKEFEIGETRYGKNGEIYKLEEVTHSRCNPYGRAYYLGPHNEKLHHIALSEWLELPKQPPIDPYPGDTFRFVSNGSRYICVITRKGTDEVSFFCISMDPIMGISFRTWPTSKFLGMDSLERMSPEYYKGTV